MVSSYAHFKGFRLSQALFVVLFVVGTGGSPLRAQVLTGRLIELGSGLPIREGMVALVNLDGETIAATTTDEDGGFSVSPGQAGQYSVYAEAFGYFASVDGPTELTVGDTTAVQFSLERNPVILEPLDISAEPRNRLLELTGFYERKELNRGQFVERAEIEERSPRWLTDIFRTGTSFRVVPAQFAGNTGGYTLVSRRFVSFQNRGYCGPMVYVNGIRSGRTYGTGTTPLDQLLDPEEVEAIEAYSGISQVPERWRDSAAGCGVVLIWTRRGP